jgi:hypothetical protein
MQEDPGARHFSFKVDVLALQFHFVSKRFEHRA